MPAVGPRPLPEMKIISPGASGPGCMLAAFTTPRTVGPPPPELVPDTVRETLTICALWEGSLGVRVIDPEYVPAVSPVGATLTLIDAGVAPDVGVAVSQMPWSRVVTVDVKEMGEPELDTFTVCGEGAAPPTVPVNVREAGITIKVTTGLATVILTGTASETPPPELIVIEPVYGPTASWAAFTETVKLPGVVPVVGETVTQFADVRAVKFVGPPALSMWTVCAGGAVAPTVCANNSDAGTAVVLAVAATLSVTGTERDVGPARIMTEPWYDPAANALPST
jgi:hypothetical protein